MISYDSSSSFYAVAALITFILAFSTFRAIIKAYRVFTLR